MCPFYSSLFCKVLIYLTFFPYQDEGCKQACSFFGFIQNETFEKGTKKFDFGKVENKISGKKEKKQRKIVNQEKQVTTAFPPHAPEVPSIKVSQKSLTTRRKTLYNF